MNNSDPKATIELHVPNFKLVYTFYQDILGFEVKQKDKTYLIAKKDSNLLCFYGGNDTIYSHHYFKKFPKQTKPGFGVEIIITVKNIKNFYEEIKNKVKIIKPLKKKHWGLQDFRIEDPFGFYLRITEQLETED